MRRILLIITGGIAAYKALMLIRELRNQDIEVVPVMTESAKEFVTPLSVAALAEQPVRSQLFSLDDEAKMGHIELSRSADAVVIAPATANFIGKVANGLADDLASTLVIATRSPVMIAPAMNVAMWESEANQANIKTLKSRNFEMIGPMEGDMACGEFGFGRLVEPTDILQAILSHFGDLPLRGRQITITSGPTHEPIDPVRYIANRSSGKQGTAIAEALQRLGANITFVTGPATAPRPSGTKIIEVQSADEMYQAVHKNLPSDVFISVAAVADWKVEAREQKIKKNNDGLPQLSFEKNPDILQSVCKSKNRPRLVIGFAAETENVLEHGQTKRERKGCDWLLANDVSHRTGIMGGEHNQIQFITKDETKAWPKASKKDVANKLAEKILDEIKKWPNA